MPAEQIATNLALINWTLLTGLAVGSFAVVVLARLATPATKGYLAFTAACAAGFGVLAYLSDTGLPTIGVGPPCRSNPAFDEPRRARARGVRRARRGDHHRARPRAGAP